MVYHASAMRTERALQEVEEVRGRLDAHRPLSPELVARIQELIVPEFLWASGGLGNREVISLMETRAFLERGVVSGGHPLEMFLELERHKDAWDMVEARAREGGALDVSFVRALHQRLTAGARGADPRPGQWKREPSAPTRRRGRTFEYAAPDAVPGLMDRLLEGFTSRHADAQVHPLVSATWLYYHFHLVHPFEGMNGHMARLLASCALTSRGYPPLVILPDEIGDYMDALAACDSTAPAGTGGPLSERHDTASLLELFARALARTARRILDVVEGRELTPAELPDSVAGSQAAVLDALVQSPEASWRVRGGTHVRKLHTRLSEACRRLVSTGPLYRIAYRAERVVPTHQLVLSQLGAKIPSGDAGIVGEVVMAIEAEPTAAGVRFPEPQRLTALITSAQLGTQVILYWEGDSEADVHYGPPEADAWSQVALERAVTRSLDRRRRAYEMLILDLNVGPSETVTRIKEQLRSQRAARLPVEIASRAPAGRDVQPSFRVTPMALQRPQPIRAREGEPPPDSSAAITPRKATASAAPPPDSSASRENVSTRSSKRSSALHGKGQAPTEPPVTF